MNSCCLPNKDFLLPAFAGANLLTRMRSYDEYKITLMNDIQTIPFQISHVLEQFFLPNDALAGHSQAEMTLSATMYDIDDRVLIALAKVRLVATRVNCRSFV
jgi:hypothetical protein